MVKSAIAAIHQPTFFPWLGYFDKIVASDVFAVLDNVQYPKKGGSWSNRVKIMISGKPDWITMPIIRNYAGMKNINEIEIDNTKNWNEKLARTIEFNYKKALYFSSVYPFINNLLEKRMEKVSEYNIFVVRALCDLLEIDTSHFILASSINSSGSATDLLISIIKHLGVDSYMCGGGAVKYQEDDKFEENGIRLVYQNFEHPAYPQFNAKEFFSGLSIIDVLMNCGAEKTSETIKKNSKRLILK
ncbi:MAG: WbqC family protein [Ignavibacteria bacterium]|nr:WbqC family protein [Ignavibacteria bacterium]